MNSCHIGWLGMDGDQQADLSVHGGPDKALHLYSHDHYAAWRKVIGDHDALNQPGAFGENICVLGLDEGDVLLGDQFFLGTAVIEVSMGRQPCWKLDARFGQKGVMAHIIKTGMCGLYFRVVTQGTATVSDGLTRMKNGDSDWPIPRLFHGLISKQHPLHRGELETLAHNPNLGKSWRDRAAKLLSVA
jgi:MOSC domain-containing protein YiiM